MKQCYVGESTMMIFAEFQFHLPTIIIFYTTNQPNSDPISNLSIAQNQIHSEIILRKLLLKIVNFCGLMTKKLIDHPTFGRQMFILVHHHNLMHSYIIILHS